MRPLQLLVSPQQPMRSTRMAFKQSYDDICRMTVNEFERRHVYSHACVRGKLTEHVLQYLTSQWTATPPTGPTRLLLLVRIVYVLDIKKYLSTKVIFRKINQIGII